MSCVPRCFRPAESSSKRAEEAAPGEGYGVDAWHDCPEDWDRMSSVSVESEAQHHVLEPVDWTDESQMLPVPDRRPLPLEDRLAAISALREAVLAPSAQPPAEACSLVEDRSNAALERFLRARKYDVPVAAPLFLEHGGGWGGGGWLQGAESIPVQLAQKKVHMQGLCHDGLPFVVVVARNHIPTGKAGLPELFRFFVYVMDTIAVSMGPGGACERPDTGRCLSPTLRSAGQFRLLVDLRWMSYANADLPAMKVAFEVLQKGFPERLRKIWLAEPPAVFLALWRLITPFVAPSTREKFNFVRGGDVHAAVARHVPQSVLPTDWGGEAELRPLSTEPAVWEVGSREGRRF